MTRPTREEVDEAMNHAEDAYAEGAYHVLAAEVRALRNDLEWMVAAAKALQVSQEQLARAIARVEALLEQDSDCGDCGGVNCNKLRAALKGGE